MESFKNIFASKTVLTTIVGAVFALLKAFGVIDLDPEVQGVIVAVLFGLAGFFRIQATTQLAADPVKAEAKANASRY